MMVSIQNVKSQFFSLCEKLKNQAEGCRPLDKKIQGAVISIIGKISMFFQGIFNCSHLKNLKSRFAYPSRQPAPAIKPNSVSVSTSIVNPSVVTPKEKQENPKVSTFAPTPNTKPVDPIQNDKQNKIYYEYKQKFLEIIKGHGELSSIPDLNISFPVKQKSLIGFVAVYNKNDTLSPNKISKIVKGVDSVGISYFAFHVKVLGSDQKVKSEHVELVYFDERNKDKPFCLNVMVFPEDEDEEKIIDFFAKYSIFPRPATDLRMSDKGLENLKTVMEGSLPVKKLIDKDGNEVGEDEFITLA